MAYNEEGVRLDHLPPADLAMLGDVLGAMRAGSGIGLTVERVADLIIAALSNSAPETLDTFNEIAAALGDDPNFATTIMNLLATKASLTGAETLTNKTLTGPVISAPFGEFLRGHLYGLALANNATDANNDIDVTAGSAASDGTTPVLMTLANASTKRLDAAWSVGSGNGGLDTGTVANGTYHMWLIQRSDTGVVDALFSASATSPTMPTNYDRKRRIGSIIRASGAIRAFVQDGDFFQWRTVSQDVNASNPGSSSVTRTLSVPTGIHVLADITIRLSASDYVAITDLATADIPIDATGSADLQSANANAGTKLVRTNTSGQVRSRLNAGSSVTLTIGTRGWFDTRGRT